MVNNTASAFTNKQHIPNLHGCLTQAARALPYCNTSLSTSARLDDLLSHFSLAELLQQITPQTDLFGGVDTCYTVTRGLDRIGLPPWLWLIEANTKINTDCVAMDRCATTFVGPLGMAASFNRTLWNLKGQVLGRELRALNNLHAGRRHGSRIIAPNGLTGFGPNMNIARDPRFGRTSELPGEDPVLNGDYAKAMVAGMQTRTRHGSGIPLMAAFLKHFAAYSTETGRGHDSYNISQFDFWDTYLPHYQRAFQAQPCGVMCSYNAENGVPSCANDWLLNKVLRQWSPDALVTSDCGAVSMLQLKPVQAPDPMHAAAYALMNGTDLEMGGTLFQNNLLQAMQRGLATPERIAQAVRRTFRIHFELGRFDPPSQNPWTTLGRALPLIQGTTIAVVGPQAVTKGGLFSDYAGDPPCFNRTYDCMSTIAQAIATINHGGTTRIAKGVDLHSNRTDGISQALEMAQDADAVVVVVGNDKSEEAEGRDRTDTALVGLQEPLVHQILALGRPTILVLTNGGPIAIDRLLHAPSPEQPYAIVEAFNPAVMGPPALADTLFGIHNKWGKLPLTMYPHNYIQQQPMTNYDMSKYPGRTYRYYQGTPLFGFGHGMSLTTFEFDCKPEYGNDSSSHTADGKSSLMELPRRLLCQVFNTGERMGDAVLQLFHRAKVQAVQHPLPLRALRDFVRLPDIAPGSSATAMFDLKDPNVLAVTNNDGKSVVYSGHHQLIVSQSPHAQEHVLDIFFRRPSSNAFDSMTA